MRGKWVSLLLCVGALQADEALMQTGIKHVVVVMLENRSMDNVLGWLYAKGAPSYFLPEGTDPHYLGLSKEALPAYTNLLVDGSGQIVFQSPPIKGVPSVARSPYLNSPCTNPHEDFVHFTDQIFGGQAIATMSGFLQDYASLWPESDWVARRAEICAVMEGYTEKELPLFYGLGRQYAVSDLWFCSVPTHTNPNRAFAACGTSEGQIVNGPDGVSTFYADTIWNRLSEEAPFVSWMIFWHTDAVPVIVPGPFTGPNTFVSMKRIPDLESHYGKMDAFHKLARRGKLPDFTFIEPLWTSAFNASPDGDDVIGFQGNDLHPPGDVRPTENLLANIYTSLIANEKAWQETLLIVTFDEHGGVFDHVPPPASIAPDDHFQNGFFFDRYGVRVPTLFISPKIASGGVIRGDSAGFPFDHTSLIATILKWKGIDKAKWNLGKRTDAAPTFENIITLLQGRQDAVKKADRCKKIQMGDRFFLKNKNGEYLSHADPLFPGIARVGLPQDRVILSFAGSSEALMHGSFLQIQSHDPALGTANLLGTSVTDSYCVYAEDSHNPSQWWTVKSLDRPIVGAEIEYGDRVYLEAHTYFDVAQYLPTRMAADPSPLGTFLKPQPITAKDSRNSYWILEKVR